MVCSPARMDANRKNAQLSTGPKTPEGKDRSRMNALKHGLCSATLLPETLELVEQRVGEWFFALKPQDEYHVWLVNHAAVASLRIDRGERMERRLRDRRALAAEVTWEDEARIEAERIGGRIALNPAKAVEELRQSPSGCDWLISRWSMLAHAADAHNGEWTTEQVTLAFLLLGTPPEFREGHRPGDLLDERGNVIETGDDRAGVARREIDRLTERREAVAMLDEADRCLTRDDLFDESNPELKRLRRYEGTLHNRLRWYLSEIRRVPDHFKPHPDVIHHWPGVFQQRGVEDSDSAAPASAVATVEVPKPKPRPAWMIVPPNPPFDLEVGELPRDGSKPDLLNILITRQEKRFTKAESRREARRRKAEKLRAG